MHLNLITNYSKLLNRRHCSECSRRPKAFARFTPHQEDCKMRSYYLAGLLVLAALTISVSSVEARGRCRGGCGSGIFHGGIFHRHASCNSGSCATGSVPGHVHTAECGPKGCTIAGVWAQPNNIVEVTGPQNHGQGSIQVRDNQGRIYYLVPQNQK